MLKPLTAWSGLSEVGSYWQKSPSKSHFWVGHSAELFVWFFRKRQQNHTPTPAINMVPHQKWDIQVIDQVCGQDGGILANFFLCVFMDQDGAEESSCPLTELVIIIINLPTSKPCDNPAWYRISTQTIRTPREPYMLYLVYFHFLWWGKLHQSSASEAFPLPELGLFYHKTTWEKFRERISM